MAAPEVTVKTARRNLMPFLEFLLFPSDLCRHPAMQLCLNSVVRKITGPKIKPSSMFLILAQARSEFLPGGIHLFLTKPALGTSPPAVMCCELFVFLLHDPLAWVEPIQCRDLPCCHCPSQGAEGGPRWVIASLIQLEIYLMRTSRLWTLNV